MGFLRLTSNIGIWTNPKIGFLLNLFSFFAIKPLWFSFDKVGHKILVGLFVDDKLVFGLWLNLALNIGRMNVGWGSKRAEGDFSYAVYYRISGA